MVIVIGAALGGLIGGGCGAPLFGGLLLATVGAFLCAWFSEGGKNREGAASVIYFTWLVITVPVGAIGFYIGRALWA